MRRLMPAALGAIFAIVPLFPSFIALTGVGFPGVTILPRGVTLAVLGFCALLALYALAVFARFPARGSQPLLLPLAAVFGAGVVAGIAGFDPVAGLLFTGIGGLGIIWHASVVRFYADRYAAVTIYWSLLLSGALAIIAAIVMVATRFPPAAYAIAHGRATGTFVLPGELAGYLIVLHADRVRARARRADARIADARLDRPGDRVRSARIDLFARRLDGSGSGLCLSLRNGQAPQPWRRGSRRARRHRRGGAAV